MSDYLEVKVLDHVLGTTAFTMPANVYLALCTVATVDADDGTTITEANYTSYARVEVSDDWAAAASGSKDNANILQLPAATGGTSTATHFALCDALTGGNMLIHGQLTSSLAISNGITPAFAVGALVVTAD